jgi:hypothetical protein
MKAAILTSYFITQPDWQRGTTWEDSTEELQPLINSCSRAGVTLIIFHDGISKTPRNTKLIKWVKIDRMEGFIANVERWFHYLKFLSANTLDMVFMVDSTDVEVINNPFPHMKNSKLYSGFENFMQVDNKWMKERQESTFSVLIPDYRKVIELNKAKRLLNCGLVGGDMATVGEFLTELTALHRVHSKGAFTDMAVFNYLVWKKFSDKVEFGNHINTQFKKFEHDNKTAWFRHK